MLPIQRSTPAEGSVGGVGGRIHDYLEAVGQGDDEQGPLFRPSRNNRTGRIDKALVTEGRHRGAVRHVEKTRGLRRQNQLVRLDHHHHSIVGVKAPPRQPGDDLRTVDSISSAVTTLS